MFAYSMKDWNRMDFRMLHYKMRYCDRLWTFQLSVVIENWSVLGTFSACRRLKL